MNITDIKIRKTQEEGRMRAIVSVTFDDEIVVHEIKVIEGPDRLFLAMPSRKLPENGGYRDIVHPINAEIRQKLETAILERYHEYRAASNGGETAEPEGGAGRGEGF